MKNFIKKMQQGKKAGGIGIFLILVFLAGNSGLLTGSHISQTKVLGAKTHVVPTPTNTPAPTPQPITIINNIYIPTQAPIVVVPTLPLEQVTPTPSNPLATPTPLPTLGQATPTPTSNPMPMPTLSPTSTPTPISQNIEIDIAYAGEHTDSTYTTTITSGETAWQAVQDAIGIANIQYTDYGGDLGIFITGFNGVDASSNQYYDFQVNGTSSSVGVSSYTVNNNDVLKFVLTSF